MGRRSNEQLSKILLTRDNEGLGHEALDRKITLATEGFGNTKFCEIVLRDRSRLSKENALTICEYVIVMKREINPRLSYIKNTIQFLAELSKSVGIEIKFNDMTKDNVLYHLDKYRKPENDDPLHKWIGSYNIKFIIKIQIFQVAALS